MAADRDIEKIRKRHDNIPQDGFPEIEKAVEHMRVSLVVRGQGSTVLDVLDDAYANANRLAPDVKRWRNVEQIYPLNGRGMPDTLLLEGEFEFTYDDETH